MSALTVHGWSLCGPVSTITVIGVTE